MSKRPVVSEGTNLNYTGYANASHLTFVAGSRFGKYLWNGKLRYSKSYDEVTPILQIHFIYWYIPSSAGNTKSSKPEDIGASLFVRQLWRSLKIQAKAFFPFRRHESQTGALSDFRPILLFQVQWLQRRRKTTLLLSSSSDAHPHLCSAQLLSYISTCRKNLRKLITLLFL